MESRAEGHYWCLAAHLRTDRTARWSGRRVHHRRCGAALAAAFGVRGYSVSDGQLLIHHLGWATRIDLSHLVRAEFRPNAIDGSLRLGAIGGVFSSVGLFSSRELGFYRGYITDSSRAVVMNFGENRVVVTPDRPEEFVAAVTLHRGYKG